VDKFRHLKPTYERHVAVVERLAGQFSCEIVPEMLGGSAGGAEQQSGGPSLASAMKGLRVDDTKGRAFAGKVRFTLRAAEGDGGAAFSFEVSVSQADGSGAGGSTKRFAMSVADGALELLSGRWNSPVVEAKAPDGPAGLRTGDASALWAAAADSASTLRDIGIGELSALSGELSVAMGHLLDMTDAAFGVGLAALPIGRDLRSVPVQFVACLFAIGLGSFRVDYVARRALASRGEYWRIAQLCHELSQGLAAIIEREWPETVRQ
jgi:hypothetical protein